MPDFMGNFKGHDNPVKWCAETVLRHNYKAFGVQYGGECWSGITAHLTYNKHKPINTCKNGLGYHWANSVYFFGGEFAVQENRSYLQYCRLKTTIFTSVSFSLFRPSNSLRNLKSTIKTRIKEHRISGSG